VLLWFKFTEMVLQGRPKAIWRVLFQRDAGLRHAMRWYTQMGRRVWPHEIFGFLRDRLTKSGPTVAEFWGAPQDSEEESMSSARPERPVGVRRAA
jgi:anaerobic magnesium-protoporphyrin IX monomethyl ester cyclase